MSGIRYSICKALLLVVSFSSLFLHPCLTNAAPISVLASKDTYITEHASLGGTSSTHGSDQSLWLVKGTTGVHRCNPLVAFDLSSYAGQTVYGETAELVLNIRSGWGGTTVTQSVSVRESLAYWDEYTSSYANFGGVGFNETIHTGANLTTRDVTYNGITEPILFSIPSSVVQDWIDNPASNNGLFLISNTSAISRDILFWSRESGLAPQLSFNAIPEPAAGTLCIGTAVGLMIFRRNRFFFSTSA